MLIKITANSNALTLGSDTVVSANNEVYADIAETHPEVDGTSGKIVALHFNRQGNIHYDVLIGTTAGKVARVQIGNLTNDGKFHTVLDSL
jgi:hypothetical protein